MPLYRVCRYLLYEVWQELLSLLPDRVTHDQRGLEGKEAGGEGESTEIKKRKKKK